MNIKQRIVVSIPVVYRTNWRNNAYNFVLKLAHELIYTVSDLNLVGFELHTIEVGNDDGYEDQLVYGVAIGQESSDMEIRWTMNEVSEGAYEYALTNCLNEIHLYGHVRIWDLTDEQREILDSYDYLILGDETFNVQ